MVHWPRPWLEEESMSFQMSSCHATCKGCSHLPGNWWYCEIPFYLVTRICWEHSRSLPLTVRQMVLPLMIRLWSPRKMLMISGAVENVCMQLKGMIPLLFLPCLPLFPRVLLLLVMGLMQGDFGLTDGESALHHVLSEVLYQGWRGPRRRVGSMRSKMSFSWTRLKGICLLSLMVMGAITPLQIGPKNELAPLPQALQLLLWRKWWAHHKLDEIFQGSVWSVQV